LKIESVNRALKHGALVLTLASAGAWCILACGSFSTQGAGNAFVGTWSCPSLPVGDRYVSITENADNSLTLSVDTDGGGGDAGTPFCQSDSWTFSGATATMRAGTSCLDVSGADVITVKSFVLTVNGNAMSVSASESVAGPGKTTANLALVSTCTKQ
jgi:hypothetical protein